MTLKSLGLAALFLVTLAGNGCAASLKGQVVDARTGEPIQGAVVVGVWTRVAGWPGLHHHELIAVKETETDAEGRFALERAAQPAFEDDESVTIYKFGFIAWNNIVAYPSWKRRPTTSVPSQIPLESFPPGASHQEHMIFIENARRASGMYGHDMIPRFSNAIRQEMSPR